MALILDSISKSFILDDGSVVEALSCITLDVADSEFVSVLGPSGCGKTTLLRIVAGLEIPTSGTIILDGEKIEGPSPRMAMIFQEYSLYPWMTVIDNIEFGLEMRGMKKDERREKAIKYLDIVGLREFADRYPYELSGGMRQRVAVARALAVDPTSFSWTSPSVHSMPRPATCSSASCSTSGKDTQDHSLVTTVSRGSLPLR